MISASNNCKLKLYQNLYSMCVTLKEDKVSKYILQMIWDRSKRSKNIRISESITSMTKNKEWELWNHPSSRGIYVQIISILGAQKMSC